MQDDRCCCCLSVQQSNQSQRAFSSLSVSFLLVTIALPLHSGGTWLGLGRPPQTYSPWDQIQVCACMHVCMVNVCLLCVNACACVSVCVYTSRCVIPPRRPTGILIYLLHYWNNQTPVRPPGRAYTHQGATTTVQGPHEVTSALSQIVQFTDYTNRADGLNITTSEVLIS